MVFLLWKHGFTLYWCRNSYFGFSMIYVWLVHLFVKSSSCVGWPGSPSHREVTDFRWSAYIRANTLLIFLSEAIWLVGRGSVSVWKSVVILHVLWSQPPFKAETSPLGIYFTVFVGICLLFSDFDAFWSMVKLDFDFSMCFPLVVICKTVWN